MPKMENATTLVEERGSVECLHSGADIDVDTVNAYRAQVLQHRHGLPHNLAGIFATFAYGGESHG